MSIFTSRKPDPKAGQPFGIDGPQGGFSAEVEMELKVGERVFVIGQMGPDVLMLRDPVDAPPCNAWISLRIDHSIDRWEVFLPDGVRASDREVRIEPLVS